jgi:hypothetical protein
MSPQAAIYYKTQPQTNYHPHHKHPCHGNSVRDTCTCLSRSCILNDVSGRHVEVSASLGRGGYKRVRMRAHACSPDSPWTGWYFHFRRRKFDDRKVKMGERRCFLGEGGGCRRKAVHNERARFCMKGAGPPHYFGNPLLQLHI